jgi:hypothetical protein
MITTICAFSFCFRVAVSSWPFQELRDDDIKDDVTCAKRIFRQHQKLSGNGFNAWYVDPLLSLTALQKGKTATNESKPADASAP